MNRGYACGGRKEKKGAKGGEIGVGRGRRSSCAPGPLHPPFKQRPFVRHRQKKSGGRGSGECCVVWRLRRKGRGGDM